MYDSNQDHFEDRDLENKVQKNLGTGDSALAAAFEKVPVGRSAPLFRKVLIAASCVLAVGGFGAVAEPLQAQSERPSAGRPNGPRVSQAAPRTRDASAPVARSSSRGSQRGGSSYSGGGRGHRGDSVKGGGSHRYRNGDRSRRGYRYGSRYRNSYYFGLTYPWSWYGGYYGPYAYGSYGYGYGYGYGGDYYRRANAGALDLDIKPEEAEIYIDGSLVGIADNYDGFPRYLWLEEGTYNVVIYHQGYETLGKQIKLAPGVVVRLKDKMVSGTSKSPQEMYEQLGPVQAARSSAREDAPLAPWRFKDRDQGRFKDRDQESRSQETEEMARERRTSGSESSGERATASRSPRSSEEWRRRGGGSRTAETVDTDLRSEASKVVFEVTPSDAVLYMDGRFVGTAEALIERGGKLLVDAGRHVVEVSRPGYKGKRIEFTVDSGATETIKISLEKSD